MIEGPVLTEVISKTLHLSLNTQYQGSKSSSRGLSILWTDLGRGEGTLTL
jgi:hypothetical protein